MWRWIVLLAATVAGNVLFRMFNRLNVAGRPRHPDGPTIFFANHQSLTDPFVILFGCLLRPFDVLLGRNPAVWSVAYASLFTGWRRLLVKPCRIILRHNPWEFDELDKTVGEMSAVLRQGENLLIFPEGQRRSGKDHSDLAPFKRGLAWLVQRHQARIIPVALLGTTELLPIGSFMPRLGKRVRVIFGDPVPSSAWNGKNLAEITAELKERLRALLAATP